MDQITFELLGALPQAAIIYVQATLLPMRHRGAFVACETLLTLCAFALRHIPMEAATGISGVMALLAMLIAPALFYSREVPLAYRLVASALGLLLAWLGEMASGSVWVACGGTYSTASGAFLGVAPSIAIHLFFVAVVLIGAWPLREILGRWDTARLSKSGSVLLCAMPVSQALFAWVMVILIIQASPDDERGPVLLASAVLAVFCVVSDALLLNAAHRYQRTLAERARSCALEARMQGQLDEYEELSSQVQSTARLRHDMRNHLLVLQQLVRDGNARQAQEYAAEVLAELRGDAPVQGLRETQRRRTSGWAKPATPATLEDQVAQAHTSEGAELILPTSQAQAPSSSKGDAR